MNPGAIYCEWKKTAKEVVKPDEIVGDSEATDY